MTYIPVPPGQQDVGPQILAAAESGSYAQLDAGDYYMNPITLPALRGRFVIEGPDSDLTTIYALSPGPALITGTAQGLAPRGIGIFGVSLDAASQNIPVGIDFEGENSSAFEALTRLQIDDVQTYGFSQAHIRIKNSLAWIINNHSAWDGGTAVEITDAGQGMISQSESIGGSDYAIKFLGVLGSHASEGAKIQGYYSNGSLGGLFTKDWSDLSGDLLDFSSCSSMMAFNATGYCTGMQFSSCQYESSGQAIQIDDNPGQPSTRITFVNCQVWLSAWPLVFNGIGHEFHGTMNDDGQPIWLQNAIDCRVSGYMRNPNASADLIIGPARPTDITNNNYVHDFGGSKGFVNVLGQPELTYGSGAARLVSGNALWGTMLSNIYKLAN